MRIIAGRFKGRRLEGPPGDGVRPTSDRLRETLFNILAGIPDEARVLDGFAGTGALGLEALSRGARHVTFVERDPRALRVLAANVARCDAGNACTIERGDFLTFVGRQPPGGFDLVLLDPPYAAENLEGVVAGAGRLIAADGLLVLEHSRRREPPAAPATVALRRSVTAGDSALAFYAPAGA